MPHFRTARFPRRAFLAAACAALAACGATAPVPFEKDGLWGYRRDGREVIPPAFAAAGEFSRAGTAFAADAQGWACLDASGSVLLRPLAVDNGPDYFSEGLARFREGGKVGFFDEACRKVIPAAYDFALPFSGGAAAVCSGCAERAEGEHKAVAGGLWGLIDRTGAQLSPVSQPTPEAAAQAAAR